MAASVRTARRARTRQVRRLDANPVTSARSRDPGADGVRRLLIVSGSRGSPGMPAVGCVIDRGGKSMSERVQAWPQVSVVAVGAGDGWPSAVYIDGEFASGTASRCVGEY